jgi:23S rRNA (cytidine1920-2'-O)/16S rRNA (cytidine1409-2'-O)-methyltransferase
LPNSRSRLDVLLVERGLFETRARAAAAVLAGDVLRLPERRRLDKPGQMVLSEVELEVATRPEFVSRGGVKLANALDEFGLSVDGASALDVGASTGGFTDCLLQRGAAHVVAVDVAYGELSWKLREDERVTVIERHNARALQPAELPYAPGLIVMDLSFISLTKVLPAVLGCAALRYDCLAMVKPQFEVGRERVGKGGVVRDASVRRDALVSVGRSAVKLGAAVMGYASSGLPGPKGNRETFLWLAESSRPGAVEDLDAAASTVEPVAVES